MKSCTTTTIILLLALNASPQDIHFSQFYNSPGTLNPALTGNILYQEFEENVLRAGCNFKNQWASVSVPYRTYSAFIDASITTVKMERSQMGFGLLLYNDDAGDGSLQNSSAMLSMSFTRGFNRFNTFRATLGFAVGFINRSVDITKLVFDNQWNGVVFDPTAASQENLSSNSVFAVNFNFGGLLIYRMNYSTILEIGSSLSHINKPRISFYDSDNRINQKFIVHAGATIKNEDKLLVEPAIMYSLQAMTQELVFGSNVTLLQRDVELILGLWYRLNRDLIPLAGLQYKSLRFSLSYDVNVSPIVVASNYRGGIELSLVVVFRKKIRGLPCNDF